MIISLRLRLLLWLLIPLTLFVAVSAALSYRSARQTADLLQDHALLASAQVIAGEIQWLDGVPHASIPPAALELLVSPEQDQVYYQVITDQDRLLAGRPDFPQALRFPLGTPAFSDIDYHGQMLRVVSQVRTLYNAGQLHKIAILVGQTPRAHDQMVADLWRPSLLRQVAMLLLAAILVVLGLTMELRPLMHLKDQLASRDSTSVSPIRPGQLQLELRPIVEAINQTIQRLNTQVAAQKRFITDAAHQLRTPLTLLDSQIQFARRLNDEERRSEVLQAMQESSRNMTELTNKLLLLSQAEASNTTAFLRQPVDLMAVSAAVLEDIVDLAQRKNIDLGLETKMQHAWVMGNEALFTAMMMNLVDNAIRYTPVNGKVTVAIAAGHEQVDISVSDNGPGIPAEVRNRVFERFFRNAAPGQEGTGLGLAIVKEIVIAAQGTVTLAAGDQQRGLAVLVQLPALATGPDEAAANKI
ncbi:two-component system, OmpR family, sensor histidine kinase TctE [Collimonas sp. OK607]|uniref:sensor histidine kinase n=1 Tax=Collimonas sp. OK607 TaxID=1798194 RepID=UPI0008F22BAA|nr:sensor histidine kinase [Collimonas sp. OK607]SFA77314.1 two-component system, OmpR family, sensor histidine kinase TctE [Collimonas sp. OK607]